MLENKEKEVCFKFDFPDFSREDIKVEVEEDKIKIRAEKEVEIKEEPIAEIPANLPAPEAVQVVKEVTPPEPVIEEPAEVGPVEVAEDPPEEAANWLLWLIGALIVLGGLALVVRRKN